MKYESILTKKYLKKCLKENLTSFEISAKTGINARAVRWYCQKHNLKFPRRPKHPNPWLKGTKGLIGPNKGSFKKGQKAWNKGKSGYSTSKRGKRFPQYAGKNSGAWKGGITPKYRKERNKFASEEKEWRLKVFRRDDWTCQECGARNKKGLGKSVVLTAHHIKRWTDYPKLRFKLENGLTLCQKCHKLTDNYCGRKVKDGRRIIYKKRIS